MNANARVHLHAFEPRSLANGPGVRAVLWFQGCDLACPGCYNPATHAAAAGQGVLVSQVVDWIDALGDGIEGVSVSGGEPLQQPKALLALAGEIRARTSLSLLVFSGYTIDEIREHPDCTAVLETIDVLIDGRYVAAQRVGRNLRGSANQGIHLLTNRYTLAQIEDTPEAEIRIDPKGNLTLAGVNPLRLKSWANAATQNVVPRHGISGSSRCGSGC